MCSILGPRFPWCRGLCLQLGEECGVRRGHPLGNHMVSWISQPEGHGILMENALV